MKRLCVYYRLAYQYRLDRIEWIVCKECQRKLRAGRLDFPEVPVRRTRAEIRMAIKMVGASLPELFRRRLDK